MQYYFRAAVKPTFNKLDCHAEFVCHYAVGNNHYMHGKMQPAYGGHTDTATDIIPALAAAVKLPRQVCCSAARMDTGALGVTIRTRGNSADMRS